MAAGLVPTLLPEARTAWDDFCFRYLSDRSGYGEALRRAIEGDPDCGVLRAVAAMLGALGHSGFDQVTEISAAHRGRAPTDWERSFVDAADRLVTHGLWGSYPWWLSHQAAHPADLISLGLAAVLTCRSGAPDRFERQAAMAERARQAVGDEPYVLGLLAMQAQDRGDLDTAHALAVRVLAEDPGHFGGAHPMAHVHYESGEHASGLAWLDDWLSRADADGDWYPHLNWHAALHTLGLGDAGATLQRYRLCSALEGASSLQDRTSLLWRCQLHGIVPYGSDVVDPPTVSLADRLAEHPRTVFVGFNVAFGLAAAGDAEKLRALAARAPATPAPGVSELLPPLALALAAYVEGDFPAATGRLLAVERQLGRYGGSHAQREIVEDTLIEAMIAAGRLEEASRRLLRRLDRRESLLDRRWLHRTRSAAVTPVA